MAEKLTLDQAVIVMGFTGIATCDFGDFHADVQRRLGRPVFTHQFPTLTSVIKDAYREGFIAMCPVRADEDTPP